MKTNLLALLLCIGLSTAPYRAEATPKTRGFLIDPSKHYVYLKFDHMGDREPLSPDETNKGLWLDGWPRRLFLIRIWVPRPRFLRAGLFLPLLPIPLRYRFT
jgi:hypothetical protein